MTDYPYNNILHDLIVNVYVLLFEQDQDTLLEVFEETLLKRIASIWQNSDPHSPFRAHLATLSNIISEASEQKPFLDDILERCDEWQLIVEPNLSKYNLLHPRPKISEPLSISSSQ